MKTLGVEFTETISLKSGTWTQTKFLTATAERSRRLHMRKDGLTRCRFSKIRTSWMSSNTLSIFFGSSLVGSSSGWPSLWSPTNQYSHPYSYFCQSSNSSTSGARTCSWTTNSATSSHSSASSASSTPNSHTSSWTISSSMVRCLHRSSIIRIMELYQRSSTIMSICKTTWRCLFLQVISHLCQFSLRSTSL